MSRTPADPLPPEHFEELLRAGAAPSPYPPRTTVLLGRYLSELDAWRRRINLTGRLTARELSEHALESIVPIALLPQSATLIDIGSGAGFPGVPLAIARPDLRLTLLEPRVKRAAFLRHVARVLPLPGAVIEEARIENVGGQTFEAAATRAVGGLEQVIGNTAFLAPGGILLLWTTRQQERARELSPLHLAEVLPIPGSNRRVIAAFRKPG